MRPEKLVMMANQIATFFDAQGGGAPAAIADHLRRFWDPVMRQEIIALARTASHGLRPSVVDAIRLLEETA
jgi:formate dehydrogenase subunit delta